MALWMAGARNNPSELTGTVQSLYVHVCVCICVCFCGRDEQISTNYGIKDVARRALSTADVAAIIPVSAALKACACFTVRGCADGQTRNARRSGCRRGVEASHGAPVEPCAANQLQSLPHPHKGSLM